MKSKLIGSKRPSFVSSGLVVAAIGLILVLLTLLAPFIGLGNRYSFVLYRWFQVPRTTAALLGGALAVIGGLIASLPFVRSWYRRCCLVSDKCRDTILRYRDRGPDLSRRAAYLYLALFIPVISLIILSNWRWTGLVNDTLFLVTSFDMLERFSSLFSNAIANPLAGLFDIFPSGLRLDMIPNLIWHAFSGGRMNNDFFLVCSALLLAGAVTAMARTVGIRWGVGILAGILVPLLLMPIFGLFPLIEHFYILWPIAYYSTAGTVLVTAMFWQIDGRSWRRSALLTASIILILIHLSLIQILFMTILAPGMLAMGVGALMASKDRAELRAKIICAVVIAVALTSAGIFHYLYAIGIDTARQVFYQELIDFMNFGRPDWHVIRDDFGMLFMNPFTYNYHGLANIDGALAPLSQLGALYLAIFGRTHESRIYGRTVLIWVVATATVIAFLHNFYFYTGLIYQGPDPRHFIPILWPYYAICLASLLIAVADHGIDVMSRAWPTARRISAYVPHIMVILVLAAPVAFIATDKVLAVIAPSLVLPRQFIVSSMPSFYSFKRNPIVDYLESAIGVAIDHDFRGTVVTMPTIYQKDVNPYASYRREGSFAYARAYMRNDLGMFGLQSFNIPTLDEETHNIAPAFYLVFRELLSRPGIDVYDKHYTLVSRLNEPIMELLGLRYIIADHELPFGQKRLAMPIPEEARAVLEGEHWFKSPIDVYELPHPNLGDYSPTHIVHAQTARSTIDVMSNPAFDGRQTVVTDDASIGDDLVPATGARMTVRLGGVALKASSTGQSVLVLPVQYSHCWRITSGGNATLFRANLAQLGVRFSGNLQLELRQVFGAFWQSACRATDAADATRLQMVDAMGAGADINKIPGDGINLIPRPEALDAIADGGGLTSIKAVAAPHGPVQEYVIAALGKFSEHYLTFSVPKLTPGPYTLSLQVRDNGTAGGLLRLQLLDGVNGAVVDYLLSPRITVKTKLEEGEKLNATIQQIDGGWLQLTLTSTLLKDTGYVIIQLGNGNFTPSGEAVTVRAVKLEHGETATPYPGLER